MENVQKYPEAQILFSDTRLITFDFLSDQTCAQKTDSVSKQSQMDFLLILTVVYAELSI